MGASTPICAHPAFPGKRDQVRGFTLIELMITMAIVAILTSIALPAYTSYIAKARRADARTQLVQVAQFMQRFYAANDSYAKDRSDNDVLGRVPADLRQSPADSTKLYALGIPQETLTATSFQLHMTPVAGGSMERDKCGAFTLSSTGLRGVLVGDTVGDSALRDTCWR